MFIDILLDQIIVLRLAQRNDPNPIVGSLIVGPYRHGKAPTKRSRALGTRSVGVGLARDGGSQPLQIKPGKTFAPQLHTPCKQNLVDQLLPRGCRLRISIIAGGVAPVEQISGR